MIVGEQNVRVFLSRSIQQSLAVQEAAHGAAPAFKQLLHPVEDRFVVIDHEDGQPIKHHARLITRPARLHIFHHPEGQRYADGKCRTHTLHRSQFDGVAKRRPKPFYDGKPQPQPRCGSAGAVQSTEFLEGNFAIFRRDAGAGVDNAEDEFALLRLALQAHTPAWGVFDGVGQQILQQATQQAGIGTHQKIVWFDIQL